MVARLVEVVDRVEDGRRACGVLLFQVDHLVVVKNTEMVPAVSEERVGANMNEITSLDAFLLAFELSLRE